MKTYLSIPTIKGAKFDRNTSIYAFDKLDGSNLRAEWSKKRGFYKFGTRKRLLGEDDPMLGKGISLIRNKYEEDLNRLFREQKGQRAIAFFEYHGPNSFAGFHEPTDEHTVTLFDISMAKGFLEPKEFLKLFGSLDHIPCLYEGYIENSFITSIYEGTLSGMTFEGVVCKGGFISPGVPLMFKIKSRAWIDKLRKRCREDTTLFESLL